MDRVNSTRSVWQNCDFVHIRKFYFDGHDVAFKKVQRIGENMSVIKIVCGGEIFREFKSFEREVKRDLRKIKKLR